MTAHVPIDPPCGECENCSSENSNVASHHASFKAISKSHIDGINFRANKFTANQIADAFASLIPGHMDWLIKKDALERWNTLLPGFLEGPELRESEFDLQPVYLIFDDLLFLRALQDVCVVVWVDDLLQVFGSRKIGWVEIDRNIRGPLLRICMVRPSPGIPRSVHNVLCVLIHEMCHALLYLECECSVCSCELNKMNGWGVTGHGPSWQRLKTAAQETANLHLKGFSDPFLLCLPSEPEVRQEGELKVKSLERLYKKIQHDDNKVERNMKKAVNEKITMEKDRKRADNDETLACVVAMFERWEEKTGKGDSEVDLGAFTENGDGEDYNDVDDDEKAKGNGWEAGGVW